MSVRRSPEAPKGVPGEDRLKGVLAAGMAQLSLRAKTNVGVQPLQPLQPLQPGSIAPPPRVLEDLPPEILAIVLGNANGMACDRINELCALSSAFAEVCRNWEFWKWQCQLRNYGIPERLNPFRLDPAPTEPIGGSWKSHYFWWCEHSLDNTTLREAVNVVLTQIAVALSNAPNPAMLWGDPVIPTDIPATTYIHPRYGHISTWDVSEVTDVSNLFGARVYPPAPEAQAPQAPLNVEEEEWNAIPFGGGADVNVTSFNADLNLWDVGKVTSMRDLFKNQVRFNQPLNRWDVSNVVDMSGMFRSAMAFNQPLNNWDVRKVTNMAEMFEFAMAFNQPLGNWKVGGVSKMNGMFRSAPSFNQPLNNWNVSNVVDVSEMFRYARSFNQSLNDWVVSKVRRARYMFSDATTFNGAIDKWDVSSWPKRSAAGFFYKPPFWHPAQGEDPPEVLAFQQDLSSWEQKHPGILGTLYVMPLVNPQGIKKRQKVRITQPGQYEGLVAMLIGIDGSDGILKLEQNNEIVIVDLEELENPYLRTSLLWEMWEDGYVVPRPAGTVMWELWQEQDPFNM